MKYLLVSLFSLAFAFASIAQEKMQSPGSYVLPGLKDSGEHYITFIEKQNRVISDAYNGLAKGLKAKSIDSLQLMVLQYREAVRYGFYVANIVRVAEFLFRLRETYLDMMKSMHDYNEANLNKLIDIELARRSAIKSNPDADTRYADQQISDFFKAMSDDQVKYISNYTNEINRVRAMR